MILPPAGTRAGVDVRGGGPGTRETEIIGPLSNPEEATAVLFTGGSAHGLAAADGVMRWCEEQGAGYATPAGLVPLVPAAVIYDLTVGERARPAGPRRGLRGLRGSRARACRSGGASAPARGAAVGKMRGREQAPLGGVGYAATRTADGETVAALAVVNATGDVIEADGSLIAGPLDDDGRMLRTLDLLAEASGPPRWTEDADRQGTTLVCVMTDAGLDKTSTAKVARMASAGVARAVDPVFTPFDGDVVFCLSSGAPPQVLADPPDRSLAATVVADAIRDGVRQAQAVTWPR